MTDKGNTKARWRKAEAHLALGELDKAREAVDGCEGCDALRIRIRNAEAPRAGASGNTASQRSRGGALQLNTLV